MNKPIVLIWGSALVIFLLFSAWHENWRGPLDDDEIARFMTRIEANETLDDAQRKILLDFMKADTGKEFLMVNLLAYQQGDIVNPETGTPSTAPALLNIYYRPFIGKLFRSAGYPVITGAAVGGYLDAWNVEANPGWSGSGLIRYRSRRDMLEAVTDPSFDDGHVYKQAALAATLAVPIEKNVGFFLSPRIWVAMMLALLAALTHLALLTFKKQEPMDDGAV